ncbi:L-threonylcarbamoyladenylate synthase [Schaalia suimastitidis]|uniref:L-threonylcarbamoyladenylate synthase n=1 Tax=Schaalia suimastitidis TaxID=121163 RepID=UPI0003F6CF1A|nr:L-threonylcarbamoyladenylate synthase [Schaalia suimastitidis]
MLRLYCQREWSANDLQVAATAVSRGDLLVLPTDTVYGIGCDATNATAVATLLAAKGRGRQMPPPVLVASPADIDTLCVNVPAAAYRLAECYWPGALTLILHARTDLGWDLGDTGGTLALRMPDHAITRELLGVVGPLAVTSANTTGHAPATNIDQATHYFGDTVAVYIDAGPTKGAVASTILDLSSGDISPIRLGPISLEDIERTLQE